MFLTGGLENPFAFFFLGPVLLSATALPPRMTLMLGGFAMLCATLLVFFHYPLPWSDDGPRRFSRTIYMLGIWVSIVLAIFVHRHLCLADRRGIAATRGCASPRPNSCSRASSISRSSTVLPPRPRMRSARRCPRSRWSSRELEREIGPDSPHAEDIALLREQAQRCRDILAKLNELSGEGEPFDRMPLPTLIEEVVAPHRNFGIEIDVNLPSDETTPIGARNPAILYGLGNILENAVDFAQRAGRGHRRLGRRTRSAIIISDDGPGFAPEVMGRIGEPYVRSRRRRRMYASDDTGLGLGFFIAKTLLERSGATLTFVNRPFPRTRRGCDYSLGTLRFRAIAAIPRS